MGRVSSGQQGFKKGFAKCSKEKEAIRTKKLWVDATNEICDLET